MVETQGCEDPVISFIEVEVVRVVTYVPLEPNIDCS